LEGYARHRDFTPFFLTAMGHECTLLFVNYKRTVSGRRINEPNEQ
jgi:hypothetical protein